MQRYPSRVLAATSAILVLAGLDLAAHGLGPEDLGLALLGLFPVVAFALSALAPS